METFKEYAERLYNETPKWYRELKDGKIMKTINFTRFPLLDRDGNVQEESMISEKPENDFFEIAFKNSETREDWIFNMSLKKHEDIELTDQAIDYFKRHLAKINPKTYLYSFERYVDK